MIEGDLSYTPKELDQRIRALESRIAGNENQIKWYRQEIADAEQELSRDKKDLEFWKAYRQQLREEQHQKLEEHLEELPD